MTYPSWYIPSSKLSPLGGNVRPQYYKSIFGIERVTSLAWARLARI